MDVVTIDSSTYLPYDLVEGYTSMIWSERFQKNSDFEMHTPHIETHRAQLPEGSLISLLDSYEVMIVEDHEINYVDVDGVSVPELVITGRSYETFLENRIAVNTHGEPWLALATYTIYEIISLIMWMWMVYNGDQDVTIADGIKDSHTAIPNTITTLSTDVSVWDAGSDTWSIPSQEYWLTEGPVYQSLLDFEALSGLGVRTIRPHGSNAQHIEFNTTVGLGRGISIIDDWTNITQMRFDVYNGLDRTRHQSDREAVIFHYDSGHIDSPKYLFSIKDWKTMATVSSSIGRVDVGNTALTGYNRRVLYVDGGDIGDLDYATFSGSLAQKGLVELAKHNVVNIFDGAISPLAPYKYGTHYGLGDLVTLLAQYGIEETARVDEYIRTEDQNGDRGYPTLSLVS